MPVRTSVRLLSESQATEISEVLRRSRLSERFRWENLVLELELPKHSATGCSICSTFRETIFSEI